MVIRQRKVNQSGSEHIHILKEIIVLYLHLISLKVLLVLTTYQAFFA